MFRGLRLAALVWSVIGLTFITAHAQVVSGGFSTSVRNTDGQPVAGATVTVVHVPTNATTTGTTRANGQAAFRGLPAGGPFTVSVKADGYADASVQGLATVLGEDTNVSVTLTSTVITMQAFVAEADRTDLDASAAGSSSLLDAARMAAQPTGNRSFADLIKTNSYVSIRAGSQLVALGTNNKFNSISVDGARINDQFGLNASGLASYNNPFSLDALEQFSVSLVPTDVRRSGFTGASVNAVTKSGTNEFKGTAYYIYTNSGLKGEDVFGTTAGTKTFNDESTRGFTFGGPILKDRLFFFINYEKYKSESVPGNVGFTPDATVLAAIDARIAAIEAADGVDGDLGSFGSPGANIETDEKRVGKLDWQINGDHRASIRWSETVGVQPNTGAYSYTSFSSGAPLTGAPSIGAGTSLSSRPYGGKRTEEVWAGQVFSNWTSDLRTQLSYSQTSYLQDSTVNVIYPEVRIYNVPGTLQSGAATSTGVLAFGTENSRHGNKIEVETKNYAFSGDYTRGNFTYTAGADYEESEFLNLFRQSSYGVFGYTNLAAFQADTPFAFTRSYYQIGTPISDAASYEQLGVFGQVKWDVSPRLNVTAGLRVDFVGQPIAPIRNTTFNNLFGTLYPGIDNASTIDGTETIAPRVSFNYAVDDDRTTQVRGGGGVFLGRAPFVFITNTIGNTAVGRFRVAQTNLTGAPTLLGYLNNTFDQDDPIGSTTDSGGSGFVALVEDGMKFPVVARGNLAIDQKVKPLNATLTLEWIYTDNIEALYTENLNLRKTTVGADGRQRFAGATATAPLVTAFPQDVYLLRNTSTGGSSYISLTLDRPMRNTWAYNVSYTRGKATEAQNMGGTTAGSNYQFNAVFNQNTVEVARSDFEIKDRFQASVSKQFHFLGFDRLPSTVSLYYEGRTGTPYSFVYNSDLNGDGFNNTDLIFVPESETDARFDWTGMTAEQKTAYFAALEATGLSKFKGRASGKNAFTQPFQNRLDLRFVQQVAVTDKYKLELFADFINFGNWLSKDLFNYIETVGVPTNTGLTRFFGAATYNSTGQIRPTITTTNGQPTVIPANSAITINNSESRWRIQLGARIYF
ncbi:MAG TPA: carboxypeptidase regulatory-like domain-containing protein [Opitutaceae bacterium]